MRAMITANPTPALSHVGPRTRRAIALVLVGLLAAACSSGSAGPKVASVSSSGGATTSGGTQPTALAYAQCMRAHGLPDFPDPGPDGVSDIKSLISQGTHPDLDPTGAAFQGAQQACQALQPTSASTPSRVDPAQTLRWAQCMRAQGIASFPDPGSDGTIHVADARAAGVELRVHRPPGTLISAGWNCWHAVKAACT